MVETPGQFEPIALSAPRRSALEVIVASATEAFGSALVLWLLGGVALSIAGGFAGDMVPSPPPIFGGEFPAGGHHHARHFNGWWHAARGGTLVFCFAIFFAHSLWVGFHEGGSRPRRRLLRILANLRENWFGLIVGNAIGAWVAVLVLEVTQAFSPLRMLWEWLWGALYPLVEDIMRFVFGASNSGSLGEWFHWYDDNQMKLTFWLLYLGGAFDDLGVPNFKTLARWAWRRFQRRNAVVVPADQAE